MFAFRIKKTGEIWKQSKRMRIQRISESGHTQMTEWIHSLSGGEYETGKQKMSDGGKDGTDEMNMRYITSEKERETGGKSRRTQKT